MNSVQSLTPRLLVVMALFFVLVPGCAHGAPAAVASAPLDCRQLGEAARELAKAVNGASCASATELVEARQGRASAERLLEAQLGELAEAERNFERLQGATEELENVAKAVNELAARGTKMKGAELEALLATATARLTEIRGTVFSARFDGLTALSRAQHAFYEDHGLPARPAVQLAPLEESCNKGHGASCLRLGLALEAGVGVAATRDGALAAFTRGCDADERYACVREARLVAAARDAGQLPRVLGRLDKACQAGEALACYELAVLVTRGEGVQHDDNTGAELFHRACLGGAMGACVEVAAMRRDGRGGARNAAQALAMYELACNGGEVFACTAAGEMLQKGEGVAVDGERARAFLQRGCAGGDATACGLTASGASR